MNAAIVVMRCSRSGNFGVVISPSGKISEQAEEFYHLGKDIAVIASIYAKGSH